MTAITFGMSNADYHAHLALGSSGLKLFQRSPLHYWAAYLDPNRERSEPTPLMRLGTAWHCAIFERDEFAQRYVELPEGLDRRTKEGKALWAEIEDSGKEPLTPASWDQIAAMALAADSHPAARVIFDQPGGAGEVSMFGTDPDTGVELKIRPDYYVPPGGLFEHGLIVDGKSIDDASEDNFARSAWNAGHAIQAALYSDVFQQVHGTKRPPAFLWLVQERDAPYATAIYSAADDLVAYGRREYRKLLPRFAECQRTGIWPGYPTVVQPLALPAWAAKQVQEGVAA